MGEAGDIGRIPITIDLDRDVEPDDKQPPEPPPRPDGPAYADPNTVHAIQCAVAPGTVEQLQQVMRAQGGGGDLAAALAQLVDMGSFMFNKLSPPNPGTAWLYPGPMPDPVAETLRLLGFTEVRLGP